MPGRTNWTRMTQLGWRVRFKYVSLPLPLHVVLSIACISPPCPLSRCKETPVDPTWVGESIPPSERKSSPATSVMVIQPTNFLRHFQESGIPPATDIPAEIPKFELGLTSVKSSKITMHCVHL